MTAFLLMVLHVYRMSDEGDLNSMQYWSENHFITWNAAAYLIGRKKILESVKEALSLPLEHLVSRIWI